MSRTGPDRAGESGAIVFSVASDMEAPSFSVVSELVTFVTEVTEVKMSQTGIENFENVV